jgi:hypothetical protein
MKSPNSPLRLRSLAGVCFAAAGLLFFANAVAYGQSSVPKSELAVGQRTQPVATGAGVADSQPLDSASGDITEDELKQVLIGKPLFLRGGYLSDTLHFDEQGNLTGESARGSYTLCGVQIEKVNLSRHKLQLEGARYGLHFLGASTYEDSTRAVDRVKITPKKKTLKITIDRERVEKPKKAKKKKHSSSDDSAAAPLPGERPADPNAPPTASSPEQAAAVLRETLDRIFAASIDARMIAAMPEFWQLYFQAAAAKTVFKPADPNVFYQDEVDQKAQLLTKFEPPSNEYAQTYGVAGMSLYHVIVGANGKPQEIVAARPIGFGLDENAVASIRNAEFEPAIRDGKAVPVLLDLVVQFRIFSKRTAVASRPGANDDEPILPGPYTVQSMETHRP